MNLLTLAIYFVDRFLWVVVELFVGGSYFSGAILRKNFREKLSSFYFSKLL